MEIEKDFGLLKVNGLYYRADSKDGKLVFVKVNKAEVVKMQKRVKDIVQSLKDNLDSEAVLTEAIIKLEWRDILSLHKMLTKSKRKYKPKTREGHCADMKIGSFILPIVD